MQAVQNVISMERRGADAPVKLRARLLTVNQLAEKLSRSPNAVRLMEKAGKIKRVPMVDGKVMFDFFQVVRDLGLENLLTG